MQHDELYSHILRRRGGLQAKASAEVQQSAGAAIRFPYTEGGLRSSRAAVYWAWLQLAIGQRLAAAATASNISVSDVLSDPSAAGIIRFAEKLGRPLSLAAIRWEASEPSHTGLAKQHYASVCIATTHHKRAPPARLLKISRKSWGSEILPSFFHLRGPLLRIHGGVFIACHAELYS